MKKKIFIAAAVIISSTVNAQVATLSNDSGRTLQTVVITANKFEQKQAETGKVLSVITRQELEKSSGKTLGEILNRQPGISIGGAYSTAGSVQTVYTRGAVAANTLILMDGIPLYDASGISSEFDLNSFAIPQIERIEILKGAQSTLYGSDAVAGVINIISRKPSGSRPSFIADLSAGSYNTFRGSLNISGVRKNIEYFAGYSKLYSDGFSSAFDKNKTDTFDDDGFKQDAVLASIGFKPLTNLAVKFYGRYNLNKGQIDAGAFVDDKDYTYQTRTIMGGSNISYKLKKTSLHLNYNFTDYERNYNNDSVNIGGYDPGPFAFYTKFIDEKYLGRSHFAELFGNINLGSNLNLVTGVDYRVNKTEQEYLYISNYSPYIPTGLAEDTANTDQYSVYASLLFKSAGFNAGVGGRYNRHSVYGGNSTFSINPSYNFSKYKVFVNISSAYRIPSLYQLYSYDYGNTALKPEESVSYEAGLQYTGSKVTARVVGFKREIKDVFNFYTDPVTFQSVYINDDRQSDHGLELEAAVALHKTIVLSANYTYLDGEIETQNAAGKDTTYSNLFRRPKNVLNVNLSYTGKRLFAATHVRSTGSIYEPMYLASPVKLAGYYVLDLSAQYIITKQLKAFADLRNITDQQYFDQEGFGTRGFNFTAGINLNF